MFWGFVAVIVAGAAGALLAYLVKRWTKGRAPKWLMPACAAVAMLGTAISNEYAWFGQMKANLKPGVGVIQSYESAQFFRPWTYVKPLTLTFIAFDAASAETQADGVFVGDVYLFSRWQDTQALQVMFNCDAASSLPVPPGQSPASLTDISWPESPEDDAMVAEACRMRGAV